MRRFFMQFMKIEKVLWRLSSLRSTSLPFICFRSRLWKFKTNDSIIYIVACWGKSINSKKSIYFVGGLGNREENLYELKSERSWTYIDL